MRVNGILNKIKYTSIIFVVSLLFYGTISSYTTKGAHTKDHYNLTKDHKDHNDLIKELQEKDSIINEYKSILSKNKRLKQHFYAVMYADSNPTDKNILEFLEKSEFENVDEAYATARLETANGKTGIGSGPYFNHFGLKNASTRFSWSQGRGKFGYVKYEAWTFSYLDFYEYKVKGYKNWQKTANKYKVINKLRNKVTIVK